jgi:hypothetical protein
MTAVPVPPSIHVGPKWQRKGELLMADLAEEIAGI